MFPLSHSLERYHLAPALLRRVGRFRRGRCRGGFHEAADLLSRASLHIVGDVRVGVQSESGTVVTQHAGQGLYIHAAGDRHGREGVSEVVEAHMLLVGVPLICWGEQLWTAYPWLEPVAAVLSALVVAVMFQSSLRREAERLLRQHWASLNGSQENQ